MIIFEIWAIVRICDLQIVCDGQFSSHGYEKAHPLITHSRFRMQDIVMNWGQFGSSIPFSSSWLFMTIGINMATSQDFFAIH
jgi:hypothetical protein